MVLRLQRRSLTKIPGADFRPEVAGLGEQSKVVGKVRVGAFADDKRQIGEASVAHRVDDSAVGGNDRNLSVLLPQRIGLALGDLDLHLIGVKLADARFLDERYRPQTVAHLGDIQESE